jgi:4-hydroxybenzoate polyprenyltransferase
MPLVGNLVVSLVCAGVAGIVLFAEREAFLLLFEQAPPQALRISLLFGGYVLFAFYSTLLREIIKDMEDVEGDRRMGLRTLPIAFGFHFSKRATVFFALLLALLLVLFSVWLVNEKEWLAFVFAWGAVILPLIYIVILLQKAEQKKDFSRLSLLSKIVMATGLVLLILISI